MRRVCNCRETLGVSPFALVTDRKSFSMTVQSLSFFLFYQYYFILIYREKFIHTYMQANSSLIWIV